MRSRRVLLVFVGAVVSLAACATGAVGTTGGGVGGSGQDSGSSNEEDGGNAYGGSDSGGLVIPDGGLTHKDAGTLPIDSGTTVPDSGSTSTGTFCVGEKSSKRNDFGTKNYDDWCDENSAVGVDFTCTDNSDCVDHFTASYEPECCYKPIAGGYCESDYSGGAQCVPQ